MRDLMPVPVALHRDHVCLVLVQVGRMDRVDRRGRIQERVGVPEVVLEREQEPKVGPAVAGVVDVQPVPGTLIELVKVRPTGRILERDPVGDHRQFPERIRSCERVQVRVVGGRVGLISGASRWLEPKLPLTMSAADTIAAARAVTKADRLEITALLLGMFAGCERRWRAHRAKPGGEPRLSVSATR